MLGVPLGVGFVFLTTGISFAVTDTKVLMVAKRGDGSEVNSLWHTEGGVNETSADMVDWPVRDLVSYGMFRSSVVDMWPYGNPEEVSVEAVNTYGDILWWVTFSTLGTEKDLLSWMQPSRMLSSSSHDMIATSDRQIYHGIPDTKMLFALESDRNISWFYVDQSDQVRPKFFLTRNNTSTQDMFPPSSGTSWWDDYLSEYLPEQQLIQVDLSSYSDTGNSYIFLTRQVVKVTKGFSMSSLLYNIYFGMWPCSTDWGAPYLDETGQTMNFTTKLFTYDIETTTVQCLTIDILEPIPASSMVSFTGKTVVDSFVEAQALVVIGYWPNGTFPTEIPSSTSSNTETTFEITTELPSSTSSNMETTVEMTTELPSSTSSNMETTVEITTEFPSSSTSSNVGTTVAITTGFASSVPSNIETTYDVTTEAHATTEGHVGTTVNIQTTTTAITTQISPMTTMAFISTSATEIETTSGTNHINSVANSVTGQCFCSCLVTKANITVISEHELQAKILQLRKELTVNYTTLSSYYRKLNSMPDSRMSAQGIGYVGVGIITSFLFFVVFLDLQFLVNTAKTVKYNLESKGKGSP
ncbi:cell wall protein DAN4-like [Mizuhopecten yessoensis]|uniref:Uncharacterized protein n=1 Tax=Mizuhopecten yessoensis TaxID=6573 RepID=A0A210QDG2_MIZYE|nr:cell wall protein DAN4-like [Mizuhopecten yessoensis]OWF46765.1 hypothetical protein KP79_PYT18877 [Mizuhopecten yessoensis]